MLLIWMGGIFAAIGVATFLASSALARLHAWWESQAAKVPLLRWVLKFQKDEATNRKIARLLGVAFILMGTVLLVLGSVI